MNWGERLFFFSDLNHWINSFVFVDRSVETLVFSSTENLRKISKGEFSWKMEQVFFFFFVFFSFLIVKTSCWCSVFCSMKRLRDDGYDNPSFKRPFGSSRGESWVVLSLCSFEFFLCITCFDGFFFFEFVEFLLILGKSVVFSCYMVCDVCKFVIRTFSVIFNNELE